MDNEHLLKVLKRIKLCADYYALKEIYGNKFGYMLKQIKDKGFVNRYESFVTLTEKGEKALQTGVIE